MELQTILSTTTLILYFQVLQAIGNRIECHPIKFVILFTIERLHSHFTVIQFFKHLYDYRPRWILLGPTSNKLVLIHFSKVSLGTEDLNDLLVFRICCLFPCYLGQLFHFLITLFSLRWINGYTILSNIIQILLENDKFKKKIITSSFKMIIIIL